MKIATIIPMDSTFFRDGRAFTMGEESDAMQSLFPPPPSVIYGALRTAYFENNIYELNKANEETDPTKNLVIHRIFLQIDNIAYYPVPLDTYIYEGSLKLLVLRDINVSHKSLSSLTHILALPNNIQAKKRDGLHYFQSLDSYKNNTSFDTDNNNFVNIHDYLPKEEEIGIGRKYNKTEEGKLFRIPFTRWESIKTSSNKGNFEIQQLKLIVHYEGLDLYDALITLGGEGKLANMEITTDTCVNNNSIIINNNECYKLYFTTSAVFSEGTIPTELFKTIGLNIYAAAVGRPTYLGGWDIKAKKPKPTVLAVPAGSVYYVKITDAQKLITFINQHPCGLKINDDINYSNQGYGYFELIKI